MPKILIVIVTWNDQETLRACLDSLAGLQCPVDRYKILVVDNGSGDRTGEFVARVFPHVELIQNSHNLGYASAVNQGLEKALRETYDFVWVMNNDVTVAPGTLSALVEACRDGERIGVAGPWIYSGEDRSRLTHVGYRILWPTGILKKLKAGRDIFRDPGTAIEDVDSILGCANLIRVPLLKEIGLFRPVYGVYFEETDFNARARRQGWRVVSVKAAQVWHKEATTMNKRLGRRAALLLRNLFIFQCLNARWYHLLVFIPYYFLWHVPYFLVRGSLVGLRIKTRQKGW